MGQAPLKAPADGFASDFPDTRFDAILVVSFGLSLLGQVQSIATSGVSMSSVIGFLIGLVLLLVLVTGEGLTWLQGRKA